MLRQADVPHPWQVNPYPDWFPDLELRGPFRRPRLDGTFVYFDRAGKVEWVSPRDDLSRTARVYGAGLWKLEPSELGAVVLPPE